MMVDTRIPYPSDGDIWREKERKGEKDDGKKFETKWDGTCMHHLPHRV